MGVLTKGTNFSSTEQVTAAKLNNLVDTATFTSDADTCNSAGGLELDASTPKKLQIKDQGVTFTKLDRTNASLATSALYGVMNAVYPVGSIYISILSTDPDELLFGNNNLSTWARFGEGRTLVSQDGSDTDFNEAEETSGAKTHTLTEAELAQHHHLAVVDGTVAETGDVTASNAISETATQSGSTFLSYQLRPATSGTFGTVGKTSQVGSGTAHNNLQPYIVVYMWKRTA